MMPPAALMSATACSAPCFNCAPKAALPPVIGPATPIFTWADAPFAPPAVTAAANARAGIDFNASDRKTKKLLVAEGIAKSFGERKIVQGLDLKLTPGTRLGLIGPNGSGKTTLLSLLDGTLKPDAGTIHRADWLKTVRFEQNRDTLDRTVTLRRALAPEGDSVLYQGRPIHVASWAKRFLFRSEQLDTPVSRLSGGEQARILIARLMLPPADLLILVVKDRDFVASLEQLDFLPLQNIGRRHRPAQPRAGLEALCGVARDAR